MCSEWHYTTREIGGWRHDNEPVGRVVMSPYANLPRCVMPFWTHAKCLLAFISYLPMWIKAKYTFIKTDYSPRFYGGPYLQAKHADICSGVLFWTACTRRPHVLSLPSRCEKSDSWRQSGSKSHERYHNVVTWHWIVYKWRRSKQRLSFHHIFFNLLVFTVSLSWRDWHSETPCSHSSNQPGGMYCQALDFLFRTNYWKCDARMQNWQIKSPPAMWKHLSFECLGVIVVALNGKSRPQISWNSDWLLKKVWIIAIFFQIFWNYYNMNENNRKTNLWRSNSYI